MSSLMRAPGFVTFDTSVTFLPHGRFSTAIGNAPFFVPRTSHDGPGAVISTRMHTLAVGASSSRHLPKRGGRLADLPPSLSVLPSKKRKKNISALSRSDKRCWACIIRTHQMVRLDMMARLPENEIVHRDRFTCVNMLTAASRALAHCRRCRLLPIVDLPCLLALEIVSKLRMPACSQDGYNIKRY